MLSSIGGNFSGRHSAGSNREIERLLIGSGAKQLGHTGGKTLYQHLLNTRNILHQWSQPLWMQDAGALHSIYSTEAYSRQLVPISNRSIVRAIIGEQAERIVYLFCMLSRKHFLGALDLLDRVPDEGLNLQGRQLKRRTLAVGKEDIFSLLVLLMANVAEQTQGGSGEPGSWLAHASLLGARLKEGPWPVPPVFGSCTKTLSAEDETRARDAYLAGLRFISTRSEAADREFLRSNSACPWTAEPSIWRAYLCLQNADPVSAKDLIRVAKVTLERWGTPWDKRLSLEDWLCFLSVLSNSMTTQRRFSQLPWPDSGNPRDFVEALKRHAENERTVKPTTPTQMQSQRWRQTGPNVDKPALSGLPLRFQKYLESFAHNRAKPRMTDYPGLSSIAWHDPNRFRIVHALEQNFDKIRQEALALDRSDFQNESEPLHREGAWTIFLLFERGQKNLSNCALCPITSRLIEDHRTVRTIAGLMYFSKMEPGTRILPHRGPTNLRLRCHLGINIPEGACGIRVGNQIRKWQPGKCLVFDDYFEHEVWNDSREVRLVLVVDLWHPDLSPKEIELLRGVHRYVFAHAKDLSRYWSTNAAARSQAKREYY